MSIFIDKNLNENNIKVVSCIIILLLFISYQSTSGIIIQTHIPYIKINVIFPQGVCFLVVLFNKLVLLIY